MEVWKPVSGYEGYYDVSSLGRVRSILRRVYRKGKSGADSWKTIRERIIGSAIAHDGYCIVCLRKDGITKRVKVHALVAEHFIGPRPLEHDVRHLDGNRRNNRLENLAYGTRKQNMDDARRHKTLAGENNGNAVLSRADADAIRALVASGQNQSLVAEKFGVSQPTVSMIVAGKTWK